MVLFEEGQSRRSVVVGPGTGVVVIEGALGGEEVIGPVEEEVIGPVEEEVIGLVEEGGIDPEAFAGRLVICELVAEPASELVSMSFWCFEAWFAPKLPPTAAPTITIMIITASSTQKVLAAKPQMICF